MSFGITNLAPESGYSNFNVRQVYDLIATAIAGQGWELVDTVDLIVTTMTYRRYVWKAPTAITGLPSDFYVIFEARFTTATGLWSVQSDALRIFMCKEYDPATNVGSKFVTLASATSVVLNGDLTAPTSWDLGTTLPTTAGAIPFHVGLFLSGSVSGPVLVAARPDHFIASNGWVNSSSHYSNVYVGAIESEMSSEDDPMPVVIANGQGPTAGASASNSPASISLGQTVGFLTHPKLTPGGSYAYVFQGNFAPTHVNGSNQGGMGYSENTWNGTAFLGSGTAPLFLGAGTVKVPVTTSGNAQTSASRGGRRGYLKGMRTTGNIMGTGQGDIYTIDGVPYQSIYTGGGTSMGSLVDTTL